MPIIERLAERRDGFTEEAEDSGPESEMKSTVSSGQAGTPARLRSG